MFCVRITWSAGPAFYGPYADEAAAEEVLKRSGWTFRPGEKNWIKPGEYGRMDAVAEVGALRPPGSLSSETPW